VAVKEEPDRREKGRFQTVLFSLGVTFDGREPSCPRLRGPGGSLPSSIRYLKDGLKSEAFRPFSWRDGYLNRFCVAEGIIRM
jgi:hypothetical protein